MSRFLFAFAALAFSAELASAQYILVQPRQQYNSRPSYMPTTSVIPYAGGNAYYSNMNSNPYNGPNAVFSRPYNPFTNYGGAPAYNTPHTAPPVTFYFNQNYRYQR